jgi:phosphohistidine phosphatase
LSASATPTVSAVRLYLVQHGLAKSADEDPLRPLTDEGADGVSRVARLATSRLGVHAERIVHSGKKRARETAEIWGALLGIDPEEDDGLAPNDDPAPWVERLSGETADVLLVGHLPHLAALAGALLTGNSSRQVIGFQQGGLITLERDATGWSVVVVLPPSVA